MMDAYSKYRVLLNDEGRAGLVEASSASVKDGSLLFFKDDEFFRAFAPGAWLEVEAE